MKPVLIIAIVFSITITLVGVVAMTNTVDDTSVARAEAVAQQAADARAEAVAQQAAVARAEVVAKATAAKVAEIRAEAAEARIAEAGKAAKVAEIRAEAAEAAIAKYAAADLEEAYVDCRENPLNTYYKCQQIRLEGADNTSVARAEAVAQQTIDDARAESVAKAVADKKEMNHSSFIFQVHTKHQIKQ